MSGPVYLIVDIYDNEGKLAHNCVATLEELATELSHFVGFEHKIRGFTLDDGETSRVNRGLPAVRTEPAPPSWDETYRAFVGAFDTPIARRRMNDEFSEDARKRMGEFNDFMRFNGG